MESIYYKFLDHFDGSYTKQIILEALNLLNSLWPYLVGGIIITTLIKVYLNKDKILQLFSGKTGISIAFAALIGVISPLGSYIIIPLAGALFLSGVPIPVLMALLISSPLIDPNLFLLTAGAFGYQMAIARLTSAFLLGLSAGYFTKWLIEQNKISLQGIISTRNSFQIRLIENSAPERNTRYFFTELYHMTKFISKFFLLGIALAAVIKILTPPRLLMHIFAGNEFLSVVISTSAGIPFYVCGGAAIPVVEQLADLGMSKGAVLAFFISGPVTKISSLILMNSIFRFRIFLIYLITGIFGAAILGVLYNIIINL